MMKAYKLYISVLMALLLVGCSDTFDWESQSGYIRFAPTGLIVEEVGSRAPIDEIDGSFGVLGYCLPYYGNTTDLDYNSGTAYWSDKYTRSTPHIFYKKEINADGTYSSAVKWLNSRYRYSFFAYYPFNSNITVNTGQNTIGSPTMTITMPNTTTPADIPDAMVATAIDVTELTGNVTLNFQHLLSGVQIRIRNYDSESLIINSAKLSGTFIKSANISFDTEGNFLLQHSGTQNITYNLAENVDASVVNKGEAMVKYIGDPVMLLANSNDKFGTNLKLSINYTHKGANTITKTVEYPFNYPTGFSPILGNIYTFELQFINNSLLLSMVVQNEEPWQEDEGDKDVTFE